MRAIQVVYFHRKPFHFQQSIEKVFAEVRKNLPDNIQPHVMIAPHLSLGLQPRIKNFLWAKRNQGAVNHITGDIHYIALGLKKENTLLTIHDIGFIHHPNPLARKILRLFWLSWPVKRAQIVTVISQATKEHVLQHVNCDPKKIVVVPNAISDEWKPAPKEFDSASPRILQIGTKLNKNVERLIKAVDGIACKLIIIGKLSAEQIQMLEKHRISYENLVNISEEELMDQYRRCDMLAFCSTLEGFGLPIVEAQAVGRPVITSKVSAMPETAGEGACLVDPYDVRAIRVGILKVIEDQVYRETLVRKGFENVKRFSPDETARRYAELYEQIARKTEV